MFARVMHSEVANVSIPWKYQISQLDANASLNNVLSTQIYIMDYFCFSETLKQ